MKKENKCKECIFVKTCYTGLKYPESRGCEKYISVGKFILDACCGTKMMWLNKNHPNVLYIDIRREEKGFIKEQPNSEVNPDIQMDFTRLSFPDKSFKLIVCDPPHIKGRRITGVIMKKFGCLNPETWQIDLQKGLKEMWRCLDDYGTLIFKWNDVQIPYSKIMKYFPSQPLFFNILAGDKAKTKATYWFCFMKLPIANEGENFFPTEDIIAVKKQTTVMDNI